MKKTKVKKIAFGVFMVVCLVLFYSLNIDIVGIKKTNAQMINLADVSSHNTPGDCWLIISNKVYNLTSFLSIHSGGSSTISSYCGRDATTYFLNRHPASSYVNYLVTHLYYQGDLAVTTPTPTLIPLPTPSPTSSPSPSSSPAPTFSPTPTFTPTSSPRPSPSPSFTSTPLPSVSPTPTPNSLCVCPNPTPSVSLAPSPTPISNIKCNSLTKEYDSDDSDKEINDDTEKDTLKNYTDSGQRYRYWNNDSEEYDD